MSDTVDRLVRMLDDERAKKEAARIEIGRELGRRAQTEADNRRLEREYGELEKSWQALDTYCTYLLALIPARRRKAVGKRPLIADREIPF